MSKNNSRSSKNSSTGNSRKIPAAVVEAREALIDEDALGLAPADDFEEIFGERCVGFFMPASGNVIQGVLEEFFETESKFNRRGEDPKKKKVYKIRVSKVDEKHPTIMVPSDPENDDETINGVHANVGDLVGVDQKGFLKGLDRCVVGQEVWIACLGKMPSSADYPQGAWKYLVKAKPVVADEVTGEVRSTTATKSGAESA